MINHGAPWPLAVDKTTQGGGFARQLWRAAINELIRMGGNQESFQKSASAMMPANSKGDHTLREATICTCETWLLLNVMVRA